MGRNEREHNIHHKNQPNDSGFTFLEIRKRQEFVLFKEPYLILSSKEEY